MDETFANVILQPVGVAGLVWTIAILSYSNRYLVYHRENVVGGAQLA